MNWKSIYDNLISKARSENRSKCSEVYYENHHITPRHIGGDDGDTNLVLLTFREHILSHYLLWRMYGYNGDRLMVLMRSNQTEEAQKLRVKLAVDSNRSGGKGFDNWKGELHPMKNPEKVKQALNTKLKKYGKSLMKMDDGIRKMLSEKMKHINNKPEVKEKRANTIRQINSTISREEKLKKYPRQKEKNANWGWVKGYYIVVNPNGNETKYDSQTDIINEMGITQSFLIRNRNKGVIDKIITYLLTGEMNSGKWNGYEIKYYKNPHPCTGKIEKKHKSHKK
jgi:hypothetical protein